MGCFYYVKDSHQLSGFFFCNVITTAIKRNSVTLRHHCMLCSLRNFKCLAMKDPPSSLFQQNFLTGHKPLLKLDEEFLRNHAKVLLRSDASDRVWEVKLVGDRLAGGWEEFAAAHNFRDGDVLVFQHDGDENFRVSVSSRSSSGDIEHESLTNVSTDDDESDDDDDDSDDEEDEGNISVKKKKKAEADSSSGHSCYVRARVTPSSLRKDRLDLSRDFNLVSHNIPPEIDLVNEHGRRWTLLLAKNKSSNVFYIRRGWLNFCFVNELSEGDSCRFKMIETGERPVLRLCPQEHNEKSLLDQVSKGKEKMTPSPFLELKFTPNRLTTGQLYISSRFTRENGINKPGEIILLNEDGRKWPSYLKMTGREDGGNEWFYLRGGWKEMCKANGVKVNDSFVLKLMWEDANPVFKFYSKTENKGIGSQRTRKKRACETVEKTPNEKASRTRVSNTNARKLQRLEPQSCSVWDQVAAVKQSIVDSLNTVRQCRSELETREHNLEASLQAIDALGERILGISKILNNNLV